MLQYSHAFYPKEKKEKENNRDLCLSEEENIQALNKLEVISHMGFEYASIPVCFIDNIMIKKQKDKSKVV